MPDVVIKNPILNSAFAEPGRHFKFSDDGITDEIVEARRKSTYFMPIPKAKKRGQNLAFETEWTQDRIEQNLHIDRIRERVALWRRGKYAGVTPTTRRLLDHWTDPDRDNKLFFCQIEALETAIYIAEVANKFDPWIFETLREANDASNPGLPRIAHKMATGSGKTVVMGMLIAWQALNKFANPQDRRFSDTFLIVTPGITIRDRLRVLLPNDPENYYRLRNLVPGDLSEDLLRAKILITNYHAFLPREKIKAPRLTKKKLNPEEPDAFKETPAEVVRRVCRELGNKKHIVVINDEAHHCYRRKPDGVDVDLKGDDKKEAAKRDEEARVWISGIEAVKAKMGVQTIYDLSATPFFLRGSGYAEGNLFPWVVSDFSLIDAIESGIVKVPRVPVSDDSMIGDLPTYRDLWARIRDGLPKKGRANEPETGDPTRLPKELQGAVHALYGNYKKAYEQWERSEARDRGQTPPVFIVVCNNTNVSKLVYDYVAGWEKPLTPSLSRDGEGAGVGETVLVPGELPIFSNVKDGHWLHRPNTILVDSTQLESGEAMTPEFKKLAAQEIEDFKAEYRERFPGRDVENLTDEDILREVMNTVGKPGKLGEQVRCVVSVSMLTEGWDANTVTHILGVRAFGTQLLCEQVVGRGLRRMSYEANENGLFEPEYAEVYGVPFSFIPCSGATNELPAPKLITRVRAMPEREEQEITFPRLIGYRYEIPAQKLDAKFTSDSKIILSTKDIPTWVEQRGIVGEIDFHTLEDLKLRREQEVSFLLAKLTLERHFRDDDGCDRPDLFPQVLAIARQWMDKCVVCKDGTFPQLLLFHEPAFDASDKIYRAIVRCAQGEPILKPRLRPFDPMGSTKFVDFNTTKPVYVTRSDRCHVSHVVGDSNWEFKFTQTLEDMPEVVRYVKNQSLGFAIPYTLDGDERNYYPDFLAHVKLPEHEEFTLILEVSGALKRDKQAKVATANTFWIPAVNNHGGLGRWSFLEIKDPWNAANAIRKHLEK